MLRSLLWIVIAVVIIGGAVMLSRIDTSKKTTHIEMIVPDNALAH